MRRVFLACVSALLLLSICGPVSAFYESPPETACAAVSQCSDRWTCLPLECGSQLPVKGHAFLLKADQGDTGGTLTETGAEAAARTVSSRQKKKELVFFLSIAGILLLWAIFVCRTIIRSDQWVEDQMCGKDPPERGGG